MYQTIVFTQGNQVKTKRIKQPVVNNVLHFLRFNPLVTSVEVQVGLKKVERRVVAQIERVSSGVLWTSGGVTVYLDLNNTPTPPVQPVPYDARVEQVKRNEWLEVL